MEAPAYQTRESIDEVIDLISTDNLLYIEI